jgi:proteasome accessory factor B
MPAYKERIDRLTLLEALIPRDARAEDCPDPVRLLSLAAEHYETCVSEDARRRAIQRDLKELLDAERIEVANPGSKPRRYRRARGDAEVDSYLWNYARRTVETILQQELPGAQFDAVWKRLIEVDSGIELGDDKLRFITDSQRLLPAAIHNGVLVDVLEALARSQTLEIGYRDADNKVTRPVVHPQALLQRGPRVYLFALKNDETDVRMYALHRITSSKLGDGPARKAEDFDLSQKLHSGGADFGNGTQIELVLRTRGYVSSLLRDCALSTNQRIEDEEEDSAFDLRVSATVPATGQLLRWLLGCGDKVEVVAPEDLRRVMAAQTAKASRLYGASEQPGGQEAADPSSPRDQAPSPLAHTDPQ